MKDASNQTRLSNKRVSHFSSPKRPTKTMKDASNQTRLSNKRVSHFSSPKRPTKTTKDASNRTRLCESPWSNWTLIEFQWSQVHWGFPLNRDKSDLNLSRDLRRNSDGRWQIVQQTGAHFSSPKRPTKTIGVCGEVARDAWSRLRRETLRPKGSRKVRCHQGA